MTMLHPRDYMGKFEIRWEPQAFLSIIRQDLAHIDPKIDSVDWTLSKLLHSEPRCARWSGIWWLLTQYQPIPNWVWQDAAWILFKSDTGLANPVPTYALLDFIESGLEPSRLERLKRTPRIPHIGQTTLAHEISLLSACIQGAAERKTKILWGMGKYDLKEMIKDAVLSK